MKMKRILAAAMLLLAAANLQARSANELRHWDFRFDADTVWRQVTIPHDFQMDLPWEKEAGGARGFKRCETGWYRTEITADPSWKDSKVLLDFEGAGMQADIFVNGKPAGEMDYGYLGAEMEIGDLLNYGGSNEILVKVYTGHSGGSRWYTGGGLFRPVRILVKNPVSIARHGVYVTTPEISGESASVAMTVEVEGFTLGTDDVQVVADYYAPDGEKIGSVSQAVPKRNYLSVIEVEMPEFRVGSPMLWDCDEPWLYRAEVSLVMDGKALDSVSERFGIRSIEFDPEYGFRLNGKKVFLKGVSNHHDMGALGAAAYPGAEERLMKRLKEFGFNHIRCSHNPYSESFLDLADEYGILIVDELYDKWMTDGGRYWIARYPFTESWFRHESEWIRRDRNHPSVIMWSFGNETQIREAWNGFPGTYDWGVTTYRVMKTFAQRFDDTRPFTVAQFPARRGSIYKDDDRFMTEVYAPELACVTDVASLNYRFREYDQYVTHNPELNIYQSEASTSELAAPFFGMDREHSVGLAYWGAVEYWGESDGWPKKGWNYSFFNSALEPYPQAYLIKSAFCDEPLVHIGIVEGERSVIEWNDILSGKTPMSDNWNREKGEKVEIYTFTNADEVELFVNGKSLGVQQNNRGDIDRRNVICWPDVDYGRGGKLTAVARNDGKEVARHTIETTGRAVALKAVCEELEGELEFVRFYAVDSRGRIVRNACPEVLIELEGSGEIVAVDNQDHYTDELFDVNPKKMKDGFVMAIVRKAGDSCTLKASAKGLKPAVVEIAAEGGKNL